MTITVEFRSPLAAQMSSPRTNGSPRSVRRGPLPVPVPVSVPMAREPPSNSENHRSDRSAASAAVYTSMVRISVKDSGAGLAARDIAKLFTEGTQFNANKLQGGGGSGFGLFITKGIVTQHKGGRIWCESQGEGHGCTFIIELPVLDVLQLPPEEIRWMNNAVNNPRANSVGSVGSIANSPTGSPRGLTPECGQGEGVASNPARMADAVAAALADPAQTAPACLLPAGLHVLVVDDSDMNRKVSGGKRCPAKTHCPYARLAGHPGTSTPSPP